MGRVAAVQRRPIAPLASGRRPRASEQPSTAGAPHHDATPTAGIIQRQMYFPGNNFAKCIQSFGTCIVTRVELGGWDEGARWDAHEGPLC